MALAKGHGRHAPLEDLVGYIVFMIVLVVFTVAGIFVLPQVLNTLFTDADEPAQ